MRNDDSFQRWGWRCGWETALHMTGRAWTAPRLPLGASSLGGGYCYCGRISSRFTAFTRGFCITMESVHGPWDGRNGIVRRCSTVHCPSPVFLALRKMK